MAQGPKHIGTVLLEFPCTEVGYVCEAEHASRKAGCQCFDCVPHLLSMIFCAVLAVLVLSSLSALAQEMC